MHYNIITENGYVLKVIESHAAQKRATEITESEYNTILAAIQSRPTAEGKGYQLKTDLTWEEYDLPPQPEPEEPELTAEEALAELDAAYREGVDSL